jgi:hypothetical protein
VLQGAWAQGRVTVLSSAKQAALETRLHGASNPPAQRGPKPPTRIAPTLLAAAGSLPAAATAAALLQRQPAGHPPASAAPQEGARLAWEPPLPAAKGAWGPARAPPPTSPDATPSGGLLAPGSHGASPASCSYQPAVGAGSGVSGSGSAIAGGDASCSGADGKARGKRRLVAHPLHAAPAAAHTLPIPTDASAWELPTEPAAQALPTAAAREGEPPLEAAQPGPADGLPSASPPSLHPRAEQAESSGAAVGAALPGPGLGAGWSRAHGRLAAAHAGLLRGGQVPSVQVRGVCSPALCVRMQRLGSWPSPCRGAWRCCPLRRVGSTLRAWL